MSTTTQAITPGITPGQPKIIAYLRVSQGDQDVENQKFGILEYANRLGFSNVIYIEDVITSRVYWKARKIGQIILSLNRGDILLASETTRLGRSSLEVLEIQQEILERFAILHIVKEGIVIGNAGQTDIERILQKTVLGLLGSMGEMERAFISNRTREALQKKKAEGVVLGRPTGGETVWELDRKYKQLLDLMKKGISVTNMLKLVADDNEKPQTNAMFYLWTKRWNITPIGFMSKATDEQKATYLKEIEAARPKIKAFLDHMETKKNKKLPAVNSLMSE
jgi:DNA invertase Pin-like site-specific DNA recombinase